MIQSSLAYGNSGSVRVRNDFYSTTNTNMHNYSSNSSTINPGQISIQQFLNNDLFSSMSRSNSQPDLTTTCSSVQTSVNQLSSSKSMSVYSDDLYVDMIDCQNSNTVDDLLLGFEADFQVSSELSDLFENDYFSDFNDTRSLFQQNDNASSLYQTVVPQRSAPSSPKVQRNSSRRPLPTKLWSKMSEEEQSRTTEELIAIINDQLGRREQLEIIRILQPDGTLLLPHQTEIRLDFSGMNDEKHRRIRNIIKFHLIGAAEPINDESDGYSSLSSNKSDPLDKRIEKALKLRQKKEQRQAAKEHRSGLFNAEHHQVLQLTKCDEDIEVDILS